MEKPKELAISGGGIKGIAFLGTIFEMDSHDMLTDLERVAGTSIGSLIATMVALKADISTVINKMFELDINKISRDRSYINLGKHAALMNNSALKNIVVEFLKLVDAEYLTLKEAYERTNIELFITTTNLNQERAIYLNRKSHPDLRLKDAIMMSAALPGIFPRVLYKNEEYVDGAVIDNFPTSVLSKHAWGIKTVKSNRKLPSGPLSNFQYISKLITIRYENSKHNTVHIEKIILVKIDDVSTTSFDINDDVKLTLIHRGISSFKDFINIE